MTTAGRSPEVSVDFVWDLPFEVKTLGQELLGVVPHLERISSIELEIGL
jgi:hypothetical protein